jgi:large subunit ribosomal protein L18
MSKLGKTDKLFQRRRTRVRARIERESTGRLRLTVHRSSQHIYAQIIDDVAGKTLVSASSVDKELRPTVAAGGNKTAAVAVGKLIAERAQKAKIKEVVFDRGGYLFHGRVKALADSARENGLAF